MKLTTQCAVYWKPNRSSDDCEEVTPVPIPNTEVKLFSADGSWGFPPVRVGRRRSCNVHYIDFEKDKQIGFVPLLPRRISSAGRAPALQAGGRRFEPVIL